MPPLQLPYSHRIASAEQCRRMDRDTISKFGLDGFTLMETAGLQAAAVIAERTKKGSAGLFVCGKGNNAGDALVTARYLAMHHRHRCVLFFPGGRENGSADMEKNLELILDMRDRGYPVHLADSFGPSAGGADYVVDGLFGTGLTRDLGSPYEEAVEGINRLECPVFALDIPSGLHADTGKQMGSAVRAGCTLSFGALKTGFYLNDGPAQTGEIVPVGLSFPDYYRPSVATLLSAGLDDVLPRIRRTADHKYSDRAVYVVAGSEGLTGAAIYASLSAWRTGAGAVTLITPKGILNVYEAVMPGIIKAPAGSGQDTFFSKSHAPAVLERLEGKNGILLIGPGLGNRETTAAFIREILEQFGGKAVIDADALAPAVRAEKPEEADWILTPHPGEAARMTDAAVKDDFERLNWTFRHATENRVWVVSKGSPVFVGTPEGNHYITGYDSRLFARAGFGDVLSGAIAGNLAITDDAETSVLRGLLNGYLKADRLRHSLDRPLEPNDLL